MDYFFTEEQQMMREVAREIAEKRIRPVAAEFDETGEFPWEITKAIADADLFRVFIPEEYEGMDLGMPITNMCIVTEELSKACGGISLGFAATGLGTMPILIAGNEEQKAKYLPRIASGTLAAFALTEANAGSDASAVATKAVLDGDHYILNGTKQWITNGGEAEIYTVFCVTDPTRGPRGISAIIVEKGTPGFSFGKKENKMGIRASATRELIFQDCRVPKENLLGKEGMGFFIAMKTFDVSRPGVAAQALGIAQGALDLAVKYSRERHQFGQPICAFQGLRWMMADMAMKIEAARALIYATARWIDQAKPKKAAMYSAMAKCFASDVAMEVTTNALQIFGGYGYMKEYPIEKYMRDAKITQIYEGTNQIQREEISKGLIAAAASGD
ncbi:MAG: acyl-CoA dehydrogenase family protein [Armatimonadota bacterium]|nr:acyl-CoA dehydrogenase family protein [Armatimonadota bacterium]MDH7480814.1 acyl-CoA dehydrogenase family protein [Armatimonadota bacterium]